MTTLFRKWAEYLSVETTSSVIIQDYYQLPSLESSLQMSAGRFRDPVVLTSYSFDEKSSMETYLDEWHTIRHTQASSFDAGSETEDEKDDQGIYTNPEAIWLEKLGFGNYITQLETGEGTEDSEEKYLKDAGLSRQQTYAIRRRMTALRTTMKVRRGKWSREGRIMRAENSDGSGNVEVKSYSQKRSPGPQSSPSQQSTSPSYAFHQATTMKNAAAVATAPPPTTSSSPRRVPRQLQFRRGKSVDMDNVPIESTPSLFKGGSHSQLSHPHNERLLSPPGGSESERFLGKKVPTTSLSTLELTSPSLSPSTRYSSSRSPRRQGGMRREPHQLQKSDQDKETTVNHSGGARLRRVELSRGNLTPVTLSLASKPIDVGDEEDSSLMTQERSSSGSSLKRRSCDVDQILSSRNTSPPQFSRRASATPIFTKTEPQTEVLKKEACSFPRSVSPASPKKAGAALDSLRSLSPTSTSSSSSSASTSGGGSSSGGSGSGGGGRESMTSSLMSASEDMKLDFGTTSYNLSSSDSDLPSFMVTPTPQGITRIQDLSPPDMEKVRSLALLELTITFDEHDIQLRARRTAKSKSYPENALSGVPLTVLLHADQKRDPSATVPLIFHEIFTHLETHCLDKEGLLRIPGSTSRVNSLMLDLEANFHYGQFSFSCIKESDICSLLKQLIRNLPVPILTREYLQTFVSIADISDLKEQVRTLNLLILLLPEVHQRMLKRLLEFLEKVVLHSATNKMDLNNVAMVIAPNLFISLPTKNTLHDVAVATKTSHIVRLLIKYQEILWIIPGQMLNQVRFLYDKEVRKLNQRNIQKYIRQMNSQNQNQTDSPHSGTCEQSHYIIRVKAPLFTRVCMAVDVCAGVTAGDIISKLQKKSRLNKDVIMKRFSGHQQENVAAGNGSIGSIIHPHVDSLMDVPSNRLKDPDELLPAGEQFLFETGGNMGERCLPNNTDMYTLVSINPNAQWIIKPLNCPDLN